LPFFTLASLQAHIEAWPLDHRDPFLNKIIILGCNGGVDIDYGGGSYTVVAMAHCLEKLGYEVHLVSLIGLEKEELSRVHGYGLGSNVFSHFLIDASSRPRIPYFVALKLVKGLSNFVERIKPDLVIYQDDVPRSIHRVVKSLKIPTMLYIHFSYLVRSRMLKYGFNMVEWKIPETIVNFTAIPRLLNEPSEADVLLANSTATKKASELACNVSDIKILNPPIINIEPKHSIDDKTNLILHAARQDRTFLEGALANFIQKYISRHRDYIILVNNNKSKKLALLANKNPNVYAVNHLSADLWNKVLTKTRYYLHFKWFEGFGIATAEATMHGAIPIVYKSPFNASWTDIARVCGNACSFSNEYEALEKIEEFENDENKRMSVIDLLRSRIREFNIEKFCIDINKTIKLL